MDVHAPLAITLALQRRRVDVLTAKEDGGDLFDDPSLLDRALALGRVIFTQDEDFLREGSRRQRTGESFAGIIYAHQLRGTIGQYVHDLELMAKVYEPEDIANRIEHLPLK